MPQRIAIVEDNPDNRFLLRLLLEHLYDLLEFEDGLEALQELPTAGADLVLMDISLPGIDGVEVLRRLREAGHLGEVAVIALTAHAMAGDRDRFLGAGFDDYLTKPITNPALLLGAIERHLSARAS